MGKGEIISHLGSGQYSIKLILDTGRVAERISELEDKIDYVTDQINAADEGSKKTRLKLLRTSYQKQKEYLEDNTPEDPTISAWCVDLTEDLSGNVGTIEVPGERGTVKIQPGYDGNAVYNESRDKQLQPVIASGPWAAFYNWAILPAWQKWEPTFRYGTITAIDGNSCDVTLDTVESSQQGLNINQSNTLSDVEIDYMTCNGGAFNVGDEVVIEFEGQSWNNPKVIGFKVNPVGCEWVESFDGELLCANHNWTSSVIGETIDCPDLPYEKESVTSWGGYVLTHETTMDIVSEALKIDTQMNISGTYGSLDLVRHLLTWYRSKNSDESQPDPGGLLQLDIDAYATQSYEMWQPAFARLTIEWKNPLGINYFVFAKGEKTGMGSGEVDVSGQLPNVEVDLSIYKPGAAAYINRMEFEVYSVVYTTGNSTAGITVRDMKILPQ